MLNVPVVLPVIVRAAPFSDAHCVTSKCLLAAYLKDLIQCDT